MLSHLRANLLLLGITLLLASVLYPLAVLAVGQGLFPSHAGGSLVKGPDDRLVGSRLIAQEFKGDEWFHSRPSAVDYNANASGGSNLSANNPKLRERAETILKSRTGNGTVPADAVTASGSGLDPHITLSNARGQLDRIAAVWASKTKRDAREVRAIVDEMLNKAAFHPLAGVVGGEAIVNVLEVNLQLHDCFSDRK